MLVACKKQTQDSPCVMQAAEMSCNLAWISHIFCCL